LHERSLAVPLRILVARPDHLGDLLLTLPAVAALRAALPGATIGLLVPAGLEGVPRRCPDVDRTIGVRFPSLLTPPAGAGEFADAARVAGLLRGQFDLALLPRPDDPWSAPLIAAAGIPIRLGYDLPRTRPFLTAALPPPGRRHVARLALDLAATAADLLGAGGQIDRRAGPPVRFVPTAGDEAEAARAVPPAAAAPLLLHPGSGWPLKNWPPQRWGELAAALARHHAAVPLVVGGPRERALVEAVTAASGGRARGLAGALSLGGLAALQRRARLVIATDSGAFHLATAVGTPAIGLYGPADPAEFGPWCPARAARVVRVALPCSPCRTLVDPPCGAAAAPACMTGIAVETVLGVADELL
jgi:ADP-heptose:LPS heptosyltransferase